MKIEMKSSFDLNGKRVARRNESFSLIELSHLGPQEITLNKLQFIYDHRKREKIFNLHLIT